MKLSEDKTGAFAVSRPSLVRFLKNEAQEKKERKWFQKVLDAEMNS